MNRMEEYRALTEQLHQPPPDLEKTLERAEKRQRSRNRRVVRSCAGAAACFAVFVLLVNFCAPVAYACSLVPGLRELAAAVTFSPSLTSAVENEFVQTVELEQTQNGITARVECLIVDQKQVNVFYRLDSERYDQLMADFDVTLVGRENMGYSVGSSSFGEANGELLSMNIDFVEADVPDSLILTIKVRGIGPARAEAPAEENSGDYLLEEHIPDDHYEAELEFLLEFDPAFTAVGKVYPVNQTVVLDGQQITVTEMEVYPTHLRVNIADSPQNTAWLTQLYFYVETDWGMRFETISNGVTATGTADSPTMVSYRAESTYFYNADHFKLVITGAEWLRKDMEQVYVNLKTGETGPMPEGVALHAVIQEGNSWILELKADYRKENHHHQILSWEYYDADGMEYHANSRSSLFGEPDENGEVTWFRERFPLKDYPFEEVWLKPAYSHLWTAETPVEIIVQ